MSTSANITKLSFAVLLINGVLVLGISLLRPALAAPYRDQEGAGQSADTPVSDDKQSAVIETAATVPPDAPPTDAPPTHDIDVPALPILPGASATTPSAHPPNDKVLEEFRKIIQEGNGELEIPPLNFPELVPKSRKQSTGSELEDFSLRLRSMASLTQAAQALVKEAQHLEASGQTAAAAALTTNIRSLKSMMKQLATDSPERTPANTPRE